MANLPDYDLGDRKLGVLPQVGMRRTAIGEIGREIGSTARTAAGTVDRIADIRRRERERAEREAERAQAKAEREAAVQERADEREAQYRIAEGVNWFKNRWNGQDVQDAQTGEWKHVPGLADRNWREMDAEKTTALDEMERLKREFRETEIYTEMTPAQRQKFERGWKFKEDEFRRAAAAKHAGLRAEKIQFQNAALDKADDDEVLMVEGKDMQTYLSTAERAAARKVLRRYGSTATVGEEIDPNSTFFGVSDIVLKGVDPETAEGRKKYDEMFRAYQAVVDEYHKNRITNLTRLAERDAPMADFMLAEARKTVWEMEGKGPDGREVWFAGGVDDKGNPLPAEMREGTISPVEAKGLHVAVDGAGEKLKKLREAKAAKLNAENYDRHKAYIAEFELALLDPKKVEETVLDYASFEAKLADDPNLTVEQEQSLLKDYRNLVTYQQKYNSDLAKARAKIAEGVEADKLEHGYVREDGAFVPASAFAKKSEAGMLDQFGESAACWNDPKTAIARVEAARMTGKLSEADYKRYRAFGEMMMDKEAQRAWFGMFGKFDIPGLTAAQYGEEDVNRDVRKKREKYTASAGIFAKTRGTRSAYVGAAEFLADALARDEAEEGRAATEELIPLETLPKVYDTVRRLARAGVDPTEAVRQIIAPSIEAGIRRNLNERLADTEYFRAIVEDFRAYGSHFTDPAMGGRGAGYYDSEEKAVTEERLRRRAGEGARHLTDAERGVLPRTKIVR